MEPRLLSPWYFILTLPPWSVQMLITAVSRLILLIAQNRAGWTLSLHQLNQVDPIPMNNNSLVLRYSVDPLLMLFPASD